MYTRCAEPWVDQQAKSVIAAPPREKVLFVCGTESIRMLEAQVIASTGCECVSVQSMREALSKVGSVRPSLVIVDAKTALADGADWCERLKRCEMGNVPISLLADPNSPSELIEGCWRAGVDDCVLRPLRIAHIRARLQAIGEPCPPGERDLCRTVLLYGESGDYQARLRQLLELNGYRVLERAVTQGLSLSAHEAVDLVCLCWETSMLGGLLRTLRNEARLAKVPAILMSSKTATPAMSVVDPAMVAWLGQADTLPEIVVQHVNRALKCTARDLRAEECVRLFCPVEFREWKGKDSEAWRSGFSFEMSSGGIFLQTLVPARPRVALEMRIHLNEAHEVVTAAGVVAWSNRYRGQVVGGQPLGMGVQFLGMPQSRRLKQMLTPSTTRIASAR